MTIDNSIFVKILTFLCLLVVCVSQSLDSDFLYFIQQWPGSTCNTNQTCCYPNTGKPAANFTIHGWWPYSMLGTAPTYCNSHSRYEESKISDLVRRMQISWPTLACPSAKGSNLWSHEWKKHGTCSGFNQHHYFEIALKIKDSIDLLQVLRNSGIKPNGRSYSIWRIADIIRGVIGYQPGVYCNVDSSGNSQLHLVYLCTDGSGNWMDCPGLPPGNCLLSMVKFPSF